MLAWPPATMLLPLVLVVSAIAAGPVLAAPQAPSSRPPNPARCAHRKFFQQAEIYAKILYGHEY